MNRRDAIARAGLCRRAAARTAARAVRRPSTSAPGPEAEALALVDRIADESASSLAGERHLARHRHRRPRGAALAAHRPFGGRAGRIASQMREDLSASGRSTPRRSRTPCAPPSKSCAARMRQRSRASRSPTATSPSVAGATRRTSSSRTSARISTCRDSSTAIIPRERHRRRRLSRTAAVVRRGSSTASSAGCRRRAAPAWCRPRF